MTSAARDVPAGPGDAEIVGQLRRHIRAVTRRYLINPNDRDDVEQEVWLRYLRSRDTIRDHNRIFGWVRITAEREAMRLMDRRGREPVPNIVVAEMATDGHGVDARMDTSLIRLLLWAEVDRLPERDRVLVMLIALHPELSRAELAARLGVAPGSVSSLRTRCLRTLRRRLAGHGITDARFRQA